MKNTPAAGKGLRIGYFSQNSCLALLALVWSALSPVAAHAALNADAVHCVALGYEYVIAHSKKGQVGVCRLTAGRLVDARKFYRGQVATDVNFCGVNGYTTRHVSEVGVCHNCAFCVLPGGEEVRVSEAMGLGFAESRCGDDHCGTLENHGNCRQDCVSGLHDSHCDGIADAICDPDCEELGAPDPDCAGPQIDPTGAEPTGAEPTGAEPMQIDAGIQPPVDAAGQPADASTQTKADSGKASPDSGCGCSAASSIDGGLWALLALAVVLRRRVPSAD